MRYIIYHFAVFLHLKELYYLYKHLGQYEKQFSVVVIVYMTTIQIATVMKVQYLTPSEFRKGSMIFLTFLPNIACEKKQLMIPTTG